LLVIYAYLLNNQIHNERDVIFSLLLLPQQYSD